MKRRIELLAPAKNKEYGIAAINHGADAVYIAGPKFGAREAAGNEMADIARLADYAHRYYAKAYMVLNTILYDHELEAARRQVYEAYHAGCDALIVQDMGLLEMDLPPIPLFASTQTDNCTPERVKFLQEVGFQRIIMARELSIAEIAAIRQVCSVDLEAFVHGSLCVSYSGRCYISQALTGRSANRGACAQLCRVPYDFYNEKGERIAKQEHLLSMKDLNLSDHLGEMMEAGVSSFKIEGRLKDLSYVKNSTAHYRKKLDAILLQDERYTAASSGQVTTNFDPDPERSFSRGFTTYFAQGRVAGMNAGAAKSTGKFLGTVNACHQKYFTLDRAVSLENGDGICFFTASGQLSGGRVNKVEGEHIYPLTMTGITKGAKIFKNYDRLFDKKLASESATRQIRAEVSVVIDEASVQLCAKDEDGVTTQLHFAHAAEPAKNVERAMQSLREQLGKSGGSMFSFALPDIRCDQPYFFPMAEINQWRRELIQAMEQNRSEGYVRATHRIEANTYPYPAKQVDYTANVANKLAEQFYQRHGVEQAATAYELKGSPQASLMYNRYCVKYEMGLCPKQGAKPTGKLYLVYRDQRLDLQFDCKKCEMTISKHVE